MQRHAKKGTGVSVKVLKESWKGSLDAILELEEQGKLLVIRAGKDNNPKFVFWNTVTPEQVEEQQIDQGRISRSMRSRSHLSAQSLKTCGINRPFPKMRMFSGHSIPRDLLQPYLQQLPPSHSPRRKHARQRNHDLHGSRTLIYRVSTCLWTINLRHRPSFLSGSSPSTILTMYSMVSFNNHHRLLQSAKD
jgi:hypothetical protein